MSIFEICALLIMLCIAVLFVSVLNTVKSGGINIAITLKVAEPEQTPQTVPAVVHDEIESDPNQADIMKAAIELQKLFLDDEQIVKPNKEASKNG